MSAYLCDDVHLATLAVAYADLVGMPPDFAQNLADALKLANLRSVNHLYAEDTPFEGCSLAQHQARTRTPAELMAMLDCWEYQSCERPEWQGSQIQQLGQALRAQFVAHSLATGRGATRAPNTWSISAHTPEPTPEPAAVPLAEQVARLRTEHPQLVSPETVKGGSLIAAAQNLRAQLKARWPGVKFSVRTSRYTGGSSLDVRWTDGPAVSLVDAIADRYQAGHFDGQTDCYDYSDSAWTRAFGDAKYVFTSRDYSDEAIAWAKSQYGDEDHGRYRGPAHLAALRDLSIKRIKRRA